MAGRRAGAWLLGGALLLPAGAPAFAQARDADALIERVRQLKGEVAPEEAGVAAPEMPEDQIRTLVQQGLDVEILAVEVVEHQGQPAYAVTVMNPPGNRNDAFRVATLLLDGATGSLLDQGPAVPRAEAADLSTATTPGSFDRAGPEIRRRSLR